jgi:hypothetical protein
MSNSELEIYKQDYSKMLELLVDFHNLHYQFVKKPNRPMRSTLRTALKRLRELQARMLITVGKAYQEQVDKNKENFKLQPNKGACITEAQQIRDENGHFVGIRKDI